VNLFELKPGAPKQAPKRKGRGHGSGNGKLPVKARRARMPEQAAA